MTLHRAERSDWGKIAPNKRSRWQHIAAKSNGVLTPGNFMSVLGGLLVSYGLYLIVNGDLVWGTLAIFFGRLGDVMDGYLADITGTKSPTGEALDAALDKTIMVFALIILTTQTLLPLGVVIVMAAHAILNSLVGVWGRIKKRKVHPSAEGKLGVGLEWLSVGLFLTAAAASGHLAWLEMICLLAAWAAFAGFVVLGVRSSLDYTEQIIKGTSRAE